MTAATAELRFWVDMALECVRRDHTPMASAGDQTGPFRTARALGMALAALHDAHALAGGRPPLLTVPASPGLVGASATIAAAAACAETLRSRYPKQARYLDPAWLNWLDRHQLGPAGSPAEIAGRAFGAAVHALGVDDPAHAQPVGYTPTGAPYTHIAPPNDPMQRYAGASWGGASRLLASPVAGFPPPPGRVNATTVNPTPHYQADFDKVVAKGVSSRGAGTRDANEELVGIYWGYDGPTELGTPPRLYMQVVLAVLDSIEFSQPGKLTPNEELRIIAGCGIAMADAGIEAWHFKYAATHMMWRPVVGVQQAVPGNGVARPGWYPLGRPDTNGAGLSLTPDFPAYPSGHATFGAAAFQLLRLYLVEQGVTSFKADGTDKVTFDFVSDEFNGRNTDPRTLSPRDHITRGYTSLWDAIVDNSISRVYLGVHWEFDGITTRSGGSDVFGVPDSPSKLGHTGGVWLGAKIANQIATHLGVSAATIAKSRI